MMMTGEIIFLKKNTVLFFGWTSTKQLTIYIYIIFLFSIYNGTFDNLPLELSMEDWLTENKVNNDIEAWLNSDLFPSIPLTSPNHEPVVFSLSNLSSSPNFLSLPQQNTKNTVGLVLSNENDNMFDIRTGLSINTSTGAEDLSIWNQLLSHQQSDLLISRPKINQLIESCPKFTLHSDPNIIDCLSPHSSAFQNQTVSPVVSPDKNSRLVHNKSFFPLKPILPKINSIDTSNICTPKSDLISGSMIDKVSDRLHVGKRAKAEAIGNDEGELVEAKNLKSEKDLDKRKRNTAASARFRARKKLKDQVLAESYRELTAKTNILEKQLIQQQLEISWLRGLVAEKTQKPITEIYSDHGYVFQHNHSIIPNFRRMDSSRNSLTRN